MRRDLAWARGVHDPVGKNIYMCMYFCNAKEVSNGGMEKCSVKLRGSSGNPCMVTELEFAKGD
jgi:hypothetical protein